MTARAASTSSAPLYEPRLEEIEGWAHELEALHARIATRFERAEPRRRSLAYLKGLLTHAERKNGWQLAEELHWSRWRCCHQARAMRSHYLRRRRARHMRL